LVLTDKPHLFEGTYSQQVLVITGKENITGQKYKKSAAFLGRPSSLLGGQKSHILAIFAGILLPDETH
jgi:hypothetical protein